MAYAGFDDTTTKLESERLLYAGKYASYVHGLGLEENSLGMYPVSMISGMDGLGCGADCNCPCNKGVSCIDGLGTEPRYSMFPPGPRPDPYEWNEWKLVQLDGKWMYRNPRDSRLFVTPSNMYDMIGIPKDPTSGFPIIFADDGSFARTRGEFTSFGQKNAGVLTVAAVAIAAVVLSEWADKQPARHKGTSKQKLMGQRFPIYKKGAV